MGPGPRGVWPDRLPPLSVHVLWTLVQSHRSRLQTSHRPRVCESDCRRLPEGPPLCQTPVRYNNIISLCCAPSLSLLCTVTLSVVRRHSLCCAPSLSLCAPSLSLLCTVTLSVVHRHSLCVCVCVVLSQKPLPFAILSPALLVSQNYS